MNPQNFASASTTAMIRTTRTPKVAIHSQASRVVSGAVASTHFRNSSKPVDGVGGSRSSLETDRDGQCFDAGSVTMTLGDAIRMPHVSDQQRPEVQVDWSGYYHCIIVSSLCLYPVIYGEELFAVCRACLMGECIDVVQWQTSF